MVTISIIGSSGSKDKMNSFSEIRFNSIIKTIESLVEEIEKPWSEITLVSGGSSGIDHIAILLAIKYKCELKLYFPCDFNEIFYDNGNYNYKYNPGKLLNNLHKDFSLKMGYEQNHSLNQIKEIIKTCYVEVLNGFYKRNIPVSKSDIILAFTNSDTDYPKDGGTAYTWNKSNSINKIHFNLKNFPY